jgi:hypothetical protein
MIKFTSLNKWYHDTDGACTVDFWIVPDEGTIIFCTAWENPRTIKPHGERCVIIDDKLCSCYVLMQELRLLEKQGHTWYLENAIAMRAKRVDGKWLKTRLSTKHH